tara:strand:- start:9473 stop:10837 length:1365 start_codon:yes stop_codon:yes gene_type:complete
VNFIRPTRVIVVDDDDDFRIALMERLELADFQVSGFTSAEAALRGIEADFPGVIVSDLRMPGLDGRQLMARLHAIDEDLPVIMITGHGDIAEAVDAMRDGAYDFVAKPFPFERLFDSLNRALEKRGLVLDNRRLTAVAAAADPDLPLLGEAAAMVRLRATIAQIADSQMDVLIEGETGVGKEVVARALHNGGRRRVHPFVAVNCGALPEGLFESELFGHEPGAFPGAVKRHIGHVERSHRGTLFLDEIESMPLAAQVKLLRVIEEREVQPVGSGVARQLDLRILASAKGALGEAVARGEFRDDLFYRLNVVTLRVAPLRERREDIPLLFAHFLGKAARAEGHRPPAMTATIRHRLMSHDWPGNVRELDHFARRVALGLDALPAADAPTPDAGLADRVSQYEAELLREALLAAAGDISTVSDALKIPRKTLYDKLQKHALKPGDFRRPGRPSAEN